MYLDLFIIKCTYYTRTSHPLMDKSLRYINVFVVPGTINHEMNHFDFTISVELFYCNINFL